MPARQPFTSLCRTTGRLPHRGRADLHLHTTASDGTYTPSQVVDLARRSGLGAIALTDHDTLAGLDEARAAAQGLGVEIIPGVEITCEHHDRELHLLAYFVRPDDGPLRAVLARLCAHRLERYRDMIERLQRLGVSIPQQELQGPTVGSLGRRNLAELLVKVRRAGSVREAFARYLGEHGPVAVPKLRLAVAQAIDLVHQAGGVAAWAHPSYHEGTRDTLAELQGLGLGAVEVEYPGLRSEQRRQLRQWAGELGLAVTGGSDCHGPDHPRRAVGAATISAGELEVLRQRAISLHANPVRESRQAIEVR
jgi:hypothetical protein